MFGRRSGRSAQIVLLFTFFFNVFLLYLFTRITSALIIYDKRTLLDIGHCYTNLLPDTLSTNPTWPLEILQNTEENNGHLNNPRRRKIKKHHRKCTGIHNRLRERPHSPPLPSILLTNVQSLENKMDYLRASISFQWDIRDCNILCLTETWLTPSVPDTAVTPSDNVYVLRMYRTAEAGKTKGGGVCFMINKKWCDPRNICRSPARLIWNIFPLSAVHSISPTRFHRSLLLLFTFHHRQILAWLCTNSTMCSAATLTNTLTIPLSLRGTLTKPTSGRSCRTFVNIYPVQLEDRIHWIIATQFKKAYNARSQPAFS